MQNAQEDQSFPRVITLQATMENEAKSLIEHFEQYFTVKFAYTSADKIPAYQIRYRVYCEEFGYESVEHFPEQQEQDEFDTTALHCLIMYTGAHSTENIPAGCVRLVPALNAINNKLPLEKYCAHSLDNDAVEIKRHLIQARHASCEISRLAVNSQFRRRAGEKLTRFGEVDEEAFSDHEKRTFSLISVAAFLSATALTDLSGCTNVFAMMEPFLPRLLKRSGIEFVKIGADIDYHGIRAPYFIKTASALENMHPELRRLYDWLKPQIETNYRS